MAEILSPSPYAYLDGLPPDERLRQIRLRQHRANMEADSVIETARRARSYQASEAEIRKLARGSMVSVIAAMGASAVLGFVVGAIFVLSIMG